MVALSIRAEFVTIARGAGNDGMRIEDPSTCGALLDSVLNRKEPALIEALVDPFAPPMPTKIKASPPLKPGQALLRGEPNTMKIALTNAHDKVRALV